MLETASVFDAMAVDDLDSRVAARRALSLAKVRLDSTLGRFLKGATTMEEFEARFAACQDEFALHVAEASEEVGHEHPEHTAKILTEYYMNNRRWQPRQAAPYDDAYGPESGPTEQSAFDAGFNNHPCRNCGRSLDEHGAGQECPTDAGYGGPANDFSEFGDQLGGALGMGQPSMHPIEQRGKTQYPGPWVEGRVAEKQKKIDPSEMQDSGDGKPVLEPHQDDEDADAEKIKWSGVKTADEQNNTGLGGPEPKIDKRLWSPENMGDPEVADGRWPTERKDVVEVVGPPNNEHPLTEIGEAFTEHQTLPNNSDALDSSFQGGGPGPAPHTDTWTGTDGLAEPVTRELQPV